jgi:CheY-like chemotaxis protein
VSNLLTNAARYTPPGGEIRVTQSVTATEATIAVTDNGAGIAPELAPRIFDAFVQGTRSSDRSEGGLGLGLAIVKNLVALHGGRVAASSEGLGRGSTFTVAFPLVQAEVTAARTVETAKSESATKRVLVVDDNADAADLLAELVRTQGHAVTVAHDPHEALAVITEVRPDVALLDLGLPGMDGYQLAEHVLAQFPACCVIALTGYGQDSDRHRTATAGFAAHLVKPVKLQVLMDLIASA